MIRWSGQNPMTWSKPGTQALNWIESKKKLWSKYIKTLENTHHLKIDSKMLLCQFGLVIKNNWLETNILK